MAAAIRRERGQMLPVVVMVMLGIVGLGLVAVQIGKATVMRSDAQTAADAAALAAVREVRNQLVQQVAATGTSSFALIDDVRVNAMAADYAAKNEAHLTRPVQRNGADVRVWVTTNHKLGKGAGKESDDEQGEARARARLELVPVFSYGGGGGGGGASGGGSPTGAVSPISDKEWDKLKDEIHHPPQCTDSPDPKTNDLYPLGILLQKHGGQTHENRMLGDEPETDVGHNPQGWHFQCDNSGAIDLTFPGAPGGMAGILDAIKPKLEALGFHVLWRVPGHAPGDNEHMHIDTDQGAGPSGPSGVSATGPLQDSWLQIRLIDWNAPDITGYGSNFLGGSGGIPFGGPDPNIARLTCEVLAKYHVGGKARIALWEALIQESGVNNLPYGHSSSVGVLQALDIHGSFEQRMNAEWQMTVFLLRGWASPPGAIEYARQHPELSPGWIAQHSQQSADGSLYDPHYGQAIALNQKFCGGEGL
jgi:hypothetical protein